MSKLVIIVYDGAGYRTLAIFGYNADVRNAKNHWLNPHHLAEVCRSVSRLCAKPANRSRIHYEILCAPNSIATRRYLYELYPVVHVCVQQAPMSAGIHNINWQSISLENPHLRPSQQVAILDITNPTNERLFVGEVTGDVVVRADSRSSAEHPMHQWAGISDEDLERWRTRMDISNQFKNVEAVQVFETPIPATSLFLTAARSLWVATQSHALELEPILRQRWLSEMAQDTDDSGIQLHDDFDNNVRRLNALTHELEKVDFRAFRSLEPELIMQVACTSGGSWRSLDLSQQRGLTLAHVKTILENTTALETLFLGDDESSITRKDLLSLLQTAPDRCRIDHPLLYHFHFEEPRHSDQYPRSVFRQIIVTTWGGDNFSYRTASMHGDYLTLHEWRRIIKRLEDEFQQRPASSMYNALETISHVIAVEDNNVRPVSRMLLSYTSWDIFDEFPVVYDYKESWTLLLLLKRDGHPTFDYSCARFTESSHTRRKWRKISASKKETPLRVATGDLEEVALDLNYPTVERIPRQSRWSVDDVETIFRYVEKRDCSS